MDTVKPELLPTHMESARVGANHFSRFLPLCFAGCAHLANGPQALEGAECESMACRIQQYVRCLNSIQCVQKQEVHRNVAKYYRQASWHVEQMRQYDVEIRFDIAIATQSWYLIRLWISSSGCPLERATIYYTSPK